MAEGRAGLWGPALGVLRAWDPDWAQACYSMSLDPWHAGVLDERFLELICVALNAACTSLDEAGLRRHVRAALAAGATRDQLLFVIKCSSVVSVHSLSVAAPVLVQESGVTCVADGVAETPACDAMRAAGQWNDAWDAFADLDPRWTERFMAAGLAIYSSDLFSRKEVELLSIALDASVTHLYTPGIRRHIAAALTAGATTAEIMTVLELCVSHGVQSVNMAVPIIDEELARAE